MFSYSVVDISHSFTFGLCYNHVTMICIDKYAFQTAGIALSRFDQSLHVFY